MDLCGFELALSRFHVGVLVRLQQSYGYCCARERMSESRRRVLNEPMPPLRELYVVICALMKDLDFLNVHTRYYTYSVNFDCCNF